MDSKALKQLLDQCMAKKAQAGICQDPHTGGPLPLDQCAQQKAQEYPEQTKKIQQALQTAMSQMGQSGQIQQKSEKLGPVTSPSRLSKGLLAGLVFIVTSFAAGSVLTIRRLRQRKLLNLAHGHVLVDSCSESES
mmetsp:Transcript_6019/g.7730  ORF Transcript_6019/g.7730 Transcript_6019/m.7730 type:complete len:135 (-) Transcript_6019:41-445(-)